MEAEGDWIRLGPTPASVRQARCFTTNWARHHGLDGVADDAALVVSELAANAVIHARSDFDVHLATRQQGVRVEVWDASSTMPLLGSLTHAGMSGRGLPLVHALVSSWGVQPAADGKCVWAQIAAHAEIPAPDTSVEDLLQMWADLGQDADPIPMSFTASPAIAVSLVDLPVADLTAAETHMEDLVRELQLLLLHHSTSAPAPATNGRPLPHPAPDAVLALAVRLDAAARGLDAMRLQIRSRTLQATELGQDRLTLDLTLQPQLGAAVAEYRDAIEEAETLSGESELLTHTEALHRYAGIRRQYLNQVIEQLAGSQPGGVTTPSSSGQPELSKTGEPGV